MRKDYNLEKRKYVIIGIIFTVVLIYLVRLFSLQVLDNDYKRFADNNAFLKKIQYPSRGLIYDRNGKLMVYNQPAYDVMMIVREVQSFDTLDFCKTVGITRQQFDKRMEDMKNPRLNPGYSSYTPQTFMTQLSAQDYGRLQEKLYRFPGFFIQNRMLRQYAYPVAANVLGNIREVSPRDIERDDYYIRGDYTGDLGVERSYEPVLRGEKGVEILLRDAHGRIKGKYEDGMFDVSPVSGKNLKLSIDADLQAYGEELMKNKIGAIVAIEPSTGEILALVSSPTYDPSSLVGRERGKNYARLNRDPYKPLFDRALLAAYPPGSTFKPTQGLIFLQEGIITPNTMYSCMHGFVAGRLKVGCHAHESPLSLLPALRTSCNAYFCYGLRAMIDNRKKYGSPAKAFNLWKDYLVSMGYGYRLGVDLPGESRGFIPNSAYYSKAYGENRWSALTIISVAIGQGEVLATPIQIANLAATIANRGYFYTPHVVKEIQDTVLNPEYTVAKHTRVDKHYYDYIVEGMRMAVLGGTCRIGAIPGIDVCGKTGTAQNPHGKDHSAFMGFAPMDNPKIAIAVYVENAGFGATFGVPIGSLMMEKYLTGKISPERQYLESRMLESNTIIYSGVKKH
ncbi:penicillin-binding protein 2 [Barnesiella propionica]|uniref:penicillin-binding protein 2 n=1 Tax=Barnesiella propionica TaxID=2981781 RepID=UPI0011CA0868|nr:penicillin-binding protein 2 [Barnesiella propionica]MCU6769277.1 penicillin-binding protein 2 [Barnesiella propionica]